MGDMRVNRYARFDNAVEALDDYVTTVRTHGFNTGTAAITAKGDLLARIAELTPPAPRTVDVDTLHTLHALAKTFEHSGSERVEVAIDTTKATLYRNEYAEVRVVIGAAGEL